MVESSFRRLHTRDIWLNFFFLMGSFEFHGRKNIKVNMNSGLDSLGKLVNNTNSQKREGGYPFPSSISRDWNSCSTFQRSSMMLLPVWLEGALVTGAPLAFPHQWHFASLKGPQPPWSQTMPGCSAWQSFAKAFAQAVHSPSSSYQQTPKRSSRHNLKATAVSSP